MAAKFMRIHGIHVPVPGSRSQSADIDNPSSDGRRVLRIPSPSKSQDPSAFGCAVMVLYEPEASKARIA
ncbi:hypothetical protein [Nocardia sp. NPDC049707]|uniref:hypothetical protein n=1 Tax=Nocardia sp. NPDC049707 TaxID=3154735 RepID=UPI00343FABC0